MIEHVLHIGILEHGVAHELVVRYGAAAAHLVVGGHLVLLNLLAAQIPVIFLGVGHFFALIQLLCLARRVGGCAPWVCAESLRAFVSV